VLFFGTEYTVAATAAVMKQVHCERCGAHYHYAMARTGLARDCSFYCLNEEQTKARAHEKASAAARELLEKECEAVPCPSCGWYQQDVVAHLRKNRFPRVWKAGMGLLIACVPAGIMTVCCVLMEEGRSLLVPVASLAAVVTGAAGLVLGTRHYLICHWDPNGQGVDRREGITKAPS
jgi:hypothetical protein